MVEFYDWISIFGAFVGLFLMLSGMWGDGVGSTLAVMIGGFVMVKEILDIFID